MPHTTIIGLGSSKIQVLARITEQPLENIDFHFVDTTSIRAIPEGIAFHHIGKHATSGLGCGGDARIGQKAAVENTDILWDLIPAKERILFLASMAGGTGAGVLPTVFSLALEKKAAPTAIVTMPFVAEGVARGKAAAENLKILAPFADNLIIIRQKDLQPYLPQKTFVDQQRMFDLLNRATAWKALSQIV